MAGSAVDYIVGVLVVVFIIILIYSLFIHKGSEQKVAQLHADINNVEVKTQQLMVRTVAVRTEYENIKNAKKLAEQKLAEQKLAEQKLAEQKLAEQNILAEQNRLQEQRRLAEIANTPSSSVNQSQSTLPPGPNVIVLPPGSHFCEGSGRVVIDPKDCPEEILCDDGMIVYDEYSCRELKKCRNSDFEVYNMADCPVLCPGGEYAYTYEDC